MGDKSLSLANEELQNIGLDVGDGNIFVVMGEPRSKVETLKTWMTYIKQLNFDGKNDAQFIRLFRWFKKASVKLGAA